MPARDGPNERRSSGPRRATDLFALTPRETEVLALVLQGEGNKQIAARLNVAEQSIKDHVSVLLTKFAVPNRAALGDAGAILELTGAVGLDRSWLSQLFRTAGFESSLLRGPDLRFVAVNEAYARGAGQRPLLGRTVREAFPEHDRDGIAERIEFVYRANETIIDHETARVTDRGRGPETQILDRIFQPLCDAEGNANGVLTIAVDVTDTVSKRRRRELLHSEFAALLDQVPTGVIVADSADRLVKVNKAIERITGVRPAGFLASGALEAMSVLRLRDCNGEPVPLEQTPLARAQRGEITKRTEYLISQRTTGEDVHIRASGRPLRDAEGNVIGMLVVIEEI